MPNLIPRRPAPAQVLDPNQALNQRINQAQAPALVSAARLQAAAFTANVGLQQTTMLSVAANRAFRLSPLGEDAYQGIVNAYGYLVVSEIQRLGVGGA